MIVKSLLDVPEEQRGVLSDADASMFMRASTLDAKPTVFTRNAPDFDKFFKEGGEIFLDRLDLDGTKVSVAVGLWIVYYCTHEAPGEKRVPNLILWAYTLNRIRRKQKCEMVTMTELADEFPFGFPTQEGMDEIWESQKVSPNEEKRSFGTDRLDCKATWLQDWEEPEENILPPLEQLEYAKAKAIEYLDGDEPDKHTRALTILFQLMRKEKEVLYHHPAIPLGVMLAAKGKLSNADEMREFISSIDLMGVKCLKYLETLDNLTT